VLATSLRTSEAALRHSGDGIPAAG
jgi:hypothetical protein